MFMEISAIVCRGHTNINADNNVPKNSFFILLLLFTFLPCPISSKK